MLVPPTQGDAAHGRSYGDYIFDVTVPRGTATDHDTCLDGAVGEHQQAAHHDSRAGMHSGHSIFDQPMQYDIAIPPHRPPYGDTTMASGTHPSGLFWYHPHPHGYSRPQLNGGTSGLITVGNLCDYVRLDGRRCLLPSPEDFIDIALKDIQITGPDGKGGFPFSSDYDSTRCTMPHPGKCDFAGGEWLFTLNGMLYPTIKASSGKPQVWRLANTSPNVT
jgi:hypothetical protein